jgi:site-specific DNA-cytosine methylase
VAPTMNGFELEGSDIRATTIIAETVADPVSANEGRTYTHEGKNNFRTHNVVVGIVNVEHGLADHGSMALSPVSPAVTKSEHKGHSVVVSDAQAFGFKASHFTRGKDGEPSPIMPPLSADADKGDQDAVIFQPQMEVAPTVNGTQRQQVDGVMAVDAVGIPRRLMPLECERLQGWADNWTNVPKRTTLLLDGDAAGEGFPSDAKRYRAIGNGVAKPVAQWIAWRIRLAAAEAYLTLTSRGVP